MLDELVVLPIGKGEKCVEERMGGEKERKETMMEI